MSAEYTYLVGHRSGGMVKIGRTTGLLRRLYEIQSMSPVPVELLWFTAGGADLESHLHRAFDARRRHGEWFEFGDCLSAILAVTEAAYAALTGDGQGLTSERVRSDRRRPAVLISTMRELDSRVLAAVPADGAINPGALTTALGDVSRHQVQRALARLAQRGDVVCRKYGEWSRVA